MSCMCLRSVMRGTTSNGSWAHPPLEARRKGLLWFCLWCVRLFVRRVSRGRFDTIHYYGSRFGRAVPRGATVCCRIVRGAGSPVLGAGSTQPARRRPMSML